MEITKEELENRFTYHAPKEGQPALYEAIRDHGRIMAAHIIKHCPNSRERSLSLTKIDEAIMWANAAIARRA